VLGATYLLVVALLVGTCVAAYRKDLPWQRSSEVVLHTRQVGLGLAARSDVKFQGMRVGEVREVSTTGTTATVRLAIDPDLIGQIPGDVDAMIVPKTLFGDKYVDLRRPRSGGAGPALAAGDTIDQSATAVELGEVFDRLVPVLRSLQPARLSAVLTSLADVLDGRGDDVARALRTTQTLLHRLGPSYDDLVADVDRLAGTADVYADATDDLMSVLDDSASLSRDHLVPQEDALRAVLDAATRTVDLTRTVLRDNGPRLVTLVGRSRPVLEVLRTYSGEVPCVLRALDYGNRLANLASGVRGPYIALTIDTIVDQPAYRYPEDLPSDPRSDANVHNLPAEVPGWAPHCPVIPDRVLRLGRTPAPYSGEPYAQTLTAGGREQESQAGGAPSRRPEASTARDALARAIAAAQMGVDVSDVPPYAALLVLPLVSGSRVSVP